MVHALFALQGAKAANLPPTAPFALPQPTCLPRLASHARQSWWGVRNAPTAHIAPGVEEGTCLPILLARRVPTLLQPVPFAMPQVNVSPASRGTS